MHDSSHKAEKDLVLKKILADLIAYTAYHFNAEEALMRRANYSELEEHMEIHKSLMEKVKKLQSEFIKGNEVVRNETLIFLRNWLVKHIAGTDKKYISSMIAAGIK